MKKIVYLIIALMIVIFSAPSHLNAKPIWLKFKLGLFAKWSITFNGNCEDGMGICLAIGNTSNPSTNLTFFGYDDETNNFLIKISKQWGNAKSFAEGSFDIGEDSPVDPKLIENIPNFRYKEKIVFIKKGIYKVMDDGEYYLLTPDYYVQ